MLFAVCGCAQSPDKVAYTSPAGYDFTTPEVFEMDNNLREISGIALIDGNPDTLFAQQDEAGRLFFFALGDVDPKHAQFGKEGDYEDIEIRGGRTFVLRSDGTLMGFPVNGRHQGQISDVVTWKKPFPRGEYESLATRADKNRLYVLCKDCDTDRKRPRTTGYGFTLDKNDKITDLRPFTIQTEQIERLVPLGGTAFQPSAMAWNPFSGQWYVMSSVNMLLVVLDGNWEVKQAYPLNPALYVQPEGIAFDRHRALYISSEGGKKGIAKVFKFRFNG